VNRSTWKQRWHAEGGGAEVLRLALPLVLSNSIWTLQILIDRVLLSRYSSDAVAAAMPAVVPFWTVLVLFQYTANYATTFVSQYLGARRPERIGPAVWQALYFSIVAGLAFPSLMLLAAPYFGAIGHPPRIQELEATYFRILCFSTLPMLITASVNSFFAGRGATWTVMVIDAFGMTVNAVLAYALIPGHWGLPELGIAGAGWATVAGTSASALLGLCLFLRPRFRHEFHTLLGWQFDRELFWRLMRFGLPSGLQFALDGLAFTAFISLVGNLDYTEPGSGAASGIAFSINMVAILPMLGVAQAVSVLVGQRLGANRADLAERATWTGYFGACSYMTFVAALYLLVPDLFLWLFQSETEPDKWAAVASRVPTLLRFVAVYSLFDSINLVFAFALRGAGDTRFVILVALVLSWPLMVLPTWAALQFGWGLYWSWSFASAYIIALAITYWFRFRTGKWKTMRVIEKAPLAEPPPDAALHFNGDPALDRREEQIIVADVRDAYHQHPHAPLGAMDDAGRNVDQ
jgi:MATE family multidrug resistance protein